MRRSPSQSTDTRKLLIFGKRGVQALGIEHTIETGPGYIRNAFQRARRDGRRGSVLIVVTGHTTTAQKARITALAAQHGYTVVGGRPTQQDAPEPPTTVRRRRTRDRATGPEGLSAYPVRKPSIKHLIDPPDEGEPDQ